MTGCFATSQVREAAARLGLFDQLAEPEGASRTLEELEQQFTGRIGSAWWWEHLVGPSVSIRTREPSYTLLPRLVPQPDGPLWFVVQDQPSFGLFVCSAAVAASVLGECPAFEYYLVDLNRKWLLCENHHDWLIGVGSPVLEYLNGVPAAELES